MATYLHQGRVAFHETDAAGIVHFAQFFRYAEEAETHALDSVGLIGSTSTKGMMIPRVHVEADYHKPLRFWEHYTVHARITQLGQSSMHWEFEVKQGELLCASVRSISARLNHMGQKAPYTEEEREILSGLM
ncbi:MAG: acyl-CoA thioesterase [Akkermansia sp.]